MVVAWAHPLELLTEGFFEIVLAIIYQVFWLYSRIIWHPSWRVTCYLSRSLIGKKNWVFRACLL